MALKLIGKVDCLVCGLPADVGISLNGPGNAIHLLSEVCQINLQVRRRGELGQRLEREAIAFNPGLASFPG